MTIPAGRRCSPPSASGATLTGLVELLHVSSKRQDREEVGLQSAPGSDAATGCFANALVTILAAGAFTVCRLIFIHGAHCPARAGACRRSVAARRGSSCGARRRCIGTSSARRRCDLLPGRFGRPGSARRRPITWSRRKTCKFHPFLSIVPVGADVSFPNLDPTKHHVYSFSPAKTVRAEAVRQGPVAHGAFRQAGRRRARLQHPRRHERLHLRHRQRLDGAHECAGSRGLQRCAECTRPSDRLASLPSGTGRNCVEQGDRRRPALGFLLDPASRAAVDANDRIIDPMRSFRSLSARLTVQFALLFAAAMLGVSAALSTFIAGSASREVESQLQSSGAVYDRLWQQRAHELQNAAQLLARDFGFRAAVATGDEATMQSALGNAAARLQGAHGLHRHRRRAGFNERIGDRTVACRYAVGAAGRGAPDRRCRTLAGDRASSSPHRSWHRR